MKEKIIEKKCVDFLKKEGWDAIKLYKNGYPDRLFLKEGKVFFIEFKSKKGIPSPIQKAVIKNLKANGFKVLLINDFINFLTYYQNEYPPS